MLFFFRQNDFPVYKKRTGENGKGKTLKMCKKILDNFPVLIYNMSCVTKKEARLPKNSYRGVAQFG